MPKIKLTPRQRLYYRRLFSEDKNYYTVVDQIGQLPMLRGLFTSPEEILGFIEFMTGIFHIVWESDVYDANHRRLMNILVGIQYAIEFKKDAEAEETISLLISRFQEIFKDAHERTEERVMAAHEKLVARHQDDIPDRDRIMGETAFFLRLSVPYALQYSRALVEGELPQWSVRDREGISLDPLTYEAVYMDSVQRLKVLRRRLEAG